MSSTADAAESILACPATVTGRQEACAAAATTHLRAASLELSDERNVVALVLGVDMALLQHQAHDGRFRLDLGCRRMGLQPYKGRTRSANARHARVESGSGPGSSRTGSDTGIGGTLGLPQSRRMFASTEILNQRSPVFHDQSMVPARTSLYHARYSSAFSNTLSATGCQMPLSGRRMGSAMS